MERSFKQGFAQSAYITTGWNWFMILAGKAAEPVLTISVLYSCARLLPGVNLPVQIDNVVFIAQMVALDVGGLSLGKMAKAAARADNLEGATLARRVSISLISIMIANVVLSVLQTIIPHMPGQLVAVVEALLLIARAVMAVLYAHVIHSLKGTEQAEPGAIAADSWVMVGLSAYLLQATEHMITRTIAETTTTIERRLADIINEQSRMLTTLEQVQQAPKIDYQGIIAGVVEQFETRFQEMRQHTLVSPACETPQLETKTLSHRLVSLPAARPVRQRNTSQDNDPETTITGLLDQDKTYKVRELARLANTSPATAGRIRKDYFERLGQAVESDDETGEQDQAAASA